MLVVIFSTAVVLSELQCAFQGDVNWLGCCTQGGGEVAAAACGAAAAGDEDVSRFGAGSGPWR